MLTGKELEDAIASRPFEKVTLEYMERRIASVTYHRIGDTVTLCNIELDNGYSVRGESACVDPGNYNQEIGESLAYKQALGKLWPLFGFLLSETRMMKPVDTKPAQ